MKIKLFGIVQDIIGKNEIDIKISSDETILSLQEKLLKDFPKLKDIKKFAFAVNENYATNDLVLKNDDVVAIIPPVSGG